MIIDKLCTTQILNTAKEIEILEIDELFTYIKKNKRAYVWLSVDRKRNQIIDSRQAKAMIKSVFVKDSATIGA